MESSLLVDFNKIDFLVPEKVLGSGAYGRVLQAKIKSNPVAVKILHQKHEKYVIEWEAKMLCKYRHKNIVEFYGAFYGIKNGIVLELMEGGSLYHLLHEFTHIQYSYCHVANWSIQVLDALEYLHSNNVIHRNLKTLTMLLSNDFLTLKLSDFGTVRVIDDSMSSYRGTMLYMAPEVITHKYDQRCDIYSFGVVLWELMARQIPRLNKNGLLNEIKNCPEGIQKLIKSCWSDKFDKRPTIKDFRRAVERISCVYCLSLCALLIDSTTGKQALINQITKQDYKTAYDFPPAAMVHTLEGIKPVAPTKTLEPSDSTMNLNDSNDFFRPFQQLHRIGFVDEKEDDPIILLLKQLRPHSGILKIDDQHHYFIKEENVYEQGEGENGLEINGIWHRFIGQIKYGDCVGVGAAGAVVSAQFNGHFMAEKEIRLHRDNIKNIRELEVIRKCRECPQIVNYYGYTISGERLSIYMELMDASASEILKLRHKAANLNAFNRVSFNSGFPEQIISKLTLEVVKGLDYLKNKHRTIHRDLHPGNILLDRQGNIKLCDFAISGKLNEDFLMETFTRGCLEYLAPERLREGIQDKQNPYGPSTDVWSLGIVLAQLARGTINPYMIDSNYDALYRKIQIFIAEPPYLNWFEGFNTEFCNFTEKCLQIEPEKRPTFKDILEDPFVKKANETDKIYVAKWVVQQLNGGVLSNENRNLSLSQSIQASPNTESDDEIDPILSFQNGDNKYSNDYFKSDKNYKDTPIRELKPLVIKEFSKSNLEMVKRIGIGAFGVVCQYKVLDQSKIKHEFVAVKQFSKQYTDMEARILNECKHENIVEFICCYQDDENYYIVMEFLNECNFNSYLLDHKNQFNIGQAFDMLLQIVRGMVYLNNRLFIHGDLTAKNCMILKNRKLIKIIDFNLSRPIFNTGGKKPFNLNSAALEVLQEQNIISFKSDVWSFGTLMWVVFARQKPFTKLCDTDKLIQFIMGGKRLERPDVCPRKVYKLMRSCWSISVDDRPSFKDLWFKIQKIVLTMDTVDEITLAQENPEDDLLIYKKSTPVKPSRNKTEGFTT